MPTTFKVLGQTTATAASATTTINLITDPTFDGLSTSYVQNNVTAAQSIASIGNTTWRLMAEAGTNGFGSGVNYWTTGAKTSYEGTNSIWAYQSAASTYQIGFITGAATSNNFTFSSTTSLSTTALRNAAFAVTGGTTYYAGGYVNVSNISSSVVTGTIKWYNSSGTYLSNTSFTASVSQNVWTKLSTSVAAPATAAYALLMFYFNENQGVYLGLDATWFSTNSTTNTTFPTPSASTNNAVLTAPFNKRGDNIYSGTANSSTTITTFAGALTDLYTVPAATQSAISTVTATNLSTSATTIRILVLPSGQTAEKKNFITFDAPIGANSTEAFSLGITLGAGDKIQVSSDIADVSFSAFGSEIS
jgi:hypothetical protein